MVTASVVHDSTLGNEHKIVNGTCILVATHGNGTPFSHDSFQEDDLIELCMGLGQANLEGELWFLETKVVLLFQSTSKLMNVMHPLGVVMAWHDKPLKLHVHPPTSTQAREYVTVWGQHPSGTQALGPGRGMVSQSPLVTPP